MVRRFGRPTWVLIVALVAVLASSISVLAQGGGMVRGTVVDDKGQPVDGATVVILATGVANIVEIVWHLRDEAGARQVEGSKVGLAHVIGLGSACTINILKR